MFWFYLILLFFLWVIPLGLATWSLHWFDNYPNIWDYFPSPVKFFADNHLTASSFIGFFLFFILPWIFILGEFIMCYRYKRSYVDPLMLIEPPEYHEFREKIKDRMNDKDFDDRIKDRMG
jgi:hypothetical protein